jgi:hypothetical protein
MANVQEYSTRLKNDIEARLTSAIQKVDKSADRRKLLSTVVSGLPDIVGQAVAAALPAILDALPALAVDQGRLQQAQSREQDVQVIDHTLKFSDYHTYSAICKTFSHVCTLTKFLHRGLDFRKDTEFPIVLWKPSSGGAPTAPNNPPPPSTVVPAPLPQLHDATSTGKDKDGARPFSAVDASDSTSAPPAKRTKPNDDDASTAPLFGNSDAPILLDEDIVETPNPAEPEKSKPSNPKSTKDKKRQFDKVDTPDPESARKRAKPNTSTTEDSEPSSGRSLRPRDKRGKTASAASISQAESSSDDESERVTRKSGRRGLRKQTDSGLSERVVPADESDAMSQDIIGENED